LYENVSGLVVTLSLPLYSSTTGKLWGVAGIDITLGDLVTPVNGMRFGNHGYGFLMDTSSGSALSHPMMPATSNDNPPIFHLTDLESNSDFRGKVCGCACYICLECYHHTGHTEEADLNLTRSFVYLQPNSDLRNHVLPHVLPLTIYNVWPAVPVFDGVKTMQYVGDDRS
jgi:hypothetical protein